MVLWLVLGAVTFVTVFVGGFLIWWSHTSKDAAKGEMYEKQLDETEDALKARNRASIDDKRLRDITFRDS